MSLVAGVDSSTQSVKVVVRDAETGAWVREARAPHPDGTEVDPAAWITALDTVLDGILDGVEALSIAGQQHGMVVLDESGAVIRPALLWNDTRSAPDALDLIAELGGPAAWADAVGSVPEGEVSGTGYWSPATGEYRADLVHLALGHVPALPRVAGPGEAIGETAAGILLGPGTGDNMGAALALDVQPGDVVVSLGTSGTAFAGSAQPTADASGLVAGFADASGHFLPLVCTLNAARVLSSAAALLGVDLNALADLARAAEPGSGGLTLLPYLDGERTPNLPDARGSLHGITRANLTPQNIARASIEGMLGGLADAVDALISVGVQPRRILLVGGAAANPAVADVAATMFPVDIEVPPPGEYVADGAARQAAWVRSGRSTPPAWSDLRDGETRRVSATPQPRVREQYAVAREALHPGT